MRTSAAPSAHPLCRPPPALPSTATTPNAHTMPETSVSWGQTPDDDMNEMPVLTPEVPFESLTDTQSAAIGPKSTSYADLVPPVLSPALDHHLKTNSDNKSRNKRKAKVDSFGELSDMEDSVCQLSANHCVSDGSLYQSFGSNKVTKSPKKSKMSQLLNNSKKMSAKVDKRKTLFQEKNKKSYLKDYKMLNIKRKSDKMRQKSSYSNNVNEVNGWSVDSNHTMSSLNGFSGGKKTSAHSMHSYNGNTNGVHNNDSFGAQNTSFFDNSFKMRPKVFKSKSLLNSHSPRSETSVRNANRSAFDELIGAKKPEPEVDEIEGILFQSFETEDAISLYSKFEVFEREQKEQSSAPKTYKSKHFKSGKLISSTKTKDITKMKSWREKLFPTEKQTKRSIGLYKPFEKNTSNDPNAMFRAFISDETTAHSSQSSSNSAFVSDILDGYLKTKSDLKLNHLNADFAAPPDDSHIYSASVLKMPDFPHHSMGPPPTPSTSSQTSPTKKKDGFGRSKGLKNKQKLKTDFSDSIGFLDEEDVSNSELLLPQYPVIRETLWPDTPHTDEHMMHLYNTYVNTTYHEIQLMKKPIVPSLIMDDLYSRHFALSALQCNDRLPEPIQPTDTSDSVLSAVGLTPKAKPMSPIKESKITGRYRKDREADLAKIIAMGNRSKRQIRLPSRFHESSLLMGNQWVIPDYDSKGKTGKRRLQEEQKRLQELHQKQLEMDQRFQTQAHTSHTNTTNTDDSSQRELSLIHKKLSKTKPKMKLKMKSVSIGTAFASNYQLKIPHQRIKQMQIFRHQKNQMKALKQKSEQPLENSFKSLYSMSQTDGDKRVLSLSAKAQASASQRAHVNQLFRTLTDTMNPNNGSAVGKNTKLNKLETIKEAIETINKLVKREQQLAYIRKLLSMWNHKLKLCDKVAQKDMKPEAFKVVNEVMIAYKSSVCYKVGEALEAKRKEMQIKRAHQLVKTQVVVSTSHSENNNSAKSSPVINSVQIPVIPFKIPSKPSNQRYILPKLVPISSNSVNTNTNTNTNKLIISTSSKYPKLTPPDLHHKSVKRLSLDTELSKPEGSLLKPPILTTRPTILKPFIVSSNDDIHTSTSVTGPIINVPNISRIKSMNKSLNCKSSTSLIAPPKHNINSQTITSTTRIMLSSKSISSTNMSTATTTSLHTLGPNSEANVGKVFTTGHPLTNNPLKSVIIASETPLANDDLKKIVDSITANPDLKKVPVRLTNGMASLTIPGLNDKASNST